jgi:hypothetical protein
MKGTISRLFGIVFLLMCQSVPAADTVPRLVEMPGTQPQEIGNLESPGKCDNCHGGYNTAVEPAFNWRGSMMAHAGRDPIFWATLAIAEQDFDGAGDLCIRCHSTAGWLGGRSTPTDGSGLAAGDADGVECDYCHKLTHPDNSEHQGVMNPGFVANEPNTDDAGDPDGTEGYHGSGMSSLWGSSDKLGPYDNAGARHQFMHSLFHRDRDFCGTCHDVSNPVVGHAATNHGTQSTAEPVCIQTASECNPNNPGDDRVAFTNPVYAYGIVERTFSEYKSGMISETLVSGYPDLPAVPDYTDLPADLRGGALEAVYNAATRNGTIDGNYENPSMPRYFSCQTCHMRPVEGKGANKSGIPVRKDLPLHDMTGGNYWMGEAIQYLDGLGKLRLGGGLTTDQITAIDAAALRAREQLELAASLSVNGDTVKIVNHTGHKLISGYPEGRRMWLNIKWYDGNSTDPIREDGQYGALTVDIDGTPTVVETILDLDGANTKIYEAHMGMTQEWARTLNPDCDINNPSHNPSPLPLEYDRVTGDVELTLGELACEEPGSSHETFHFVLNNTVISDNRIPPYGMRYDIARIRNALPVPASQYGGGTPGSSYNYWDEVSLNPPQGAVYADIELLYQPTSWEYIQFLYLANNGTDPAQGGNAFLGEEGKNMLAAWLNTGMAAPHVMASATWGAATPPSDCTASIPTLLGATAGSNGEIITTWTEIPDNTDIKGYKLYYDQSGKAQFIVDKACATSECNTHTDTGLTNGQEYCYKITSYTTATCESGFSNILCATATQPGQTTTVPNVTGEHWSTAETLITDAGLVVAQPVGTDHSNDIPLDHVISQQPAADTDVQQGSEVSIVVSLGSAGAVDCALIPDKGSCNNEPLCEWQGSPKNGQCMDAVACTPTPGEETQESSCTDGIDNDCDGLIDSNDNDCQTQADCSIYGDETSCLGEPGCRWHRKRGCMPL